jgi:ribosomal-protein-alanine N-acetyltransferase
VAQLVTIDPQRHAGWTVVLKENGHVVGYVSYHNRQPWHRRLQIAYVLVPSYWQRGLMTEALRAFLTHCFDGLGTHRVEATIEPGNMHSILLMERLGFQREGLLRDQFFVNGKYRNVLMFALLEDDWRRHPSKVAK